jgi:hypothetical protein
MEAEPASNILCFIKNWRTEEEEEEKKKIVSSALYSTTHNFSVMVLCGCWFGCMFNAFILILR